MHGDRKIRESCGIRHDGGPHGGVGSIDCRDMPAPAHRPTFRALAGNAEYRALILGFLLHATARTAATLALSVTVFERSDSALLSAIALASSYLPHAVGVA